MTVVLHFHGDLAALLKRRWRGTPSLCLQGGRRASIKDVLESVGLPHTEVGRIQLKDLDIGFGHPVEDGTAYSIHPVPFPWDVSKPSVLRPQPLPSITFLVDVNVGRLARYLRAAGFDTLYDHRWNDRYLADLVRSEKRILLTRDMRLLMRKQVVFGRYVRATDPVVQLREIMGLFGIAEKTSPFTRCLECNAVLQPVAKEEIVHRLEPLTRKYYRSFSRCGYCDRIYWPGSHTMKMRRLFADQSGIWSG